MLLNKLFSKEILLYNTQVINLKKTGIINPLLLYEIGKLGHKDIFVVSDAGLPIPTNVTRIDLAVVPNIPRFLDVLEAILNEVVVEKVVLAKEILDKSKHVYDAVITLLKKYQGHLDINRDVILVPHEEFKEKYVARAKFVVRTGEYTPYANIAVICGVPF